MADIALGFLVQGNKILVQKRDQSNKVLPDLWEIPGGKLEVGESALQAVQREIYEEVGTTITHWEEILSWETAGEGESQHFHVFAAPLAQLPETLLSWAMVSPSELIKLPVPESTQKLILTKRIQDFFYEGLSKADHGGK